MHIFNKRVTLALKLSTAIETQFKTQNSTSNLHLIGFTQSFFHNSFPSILEIEIL